MTKTRGAGWVLCGLLASLAIAGSAIAAEPAAELSEAEARLSSAEARVAARQSAADEARTEYGAASRRAAPLAAEARRATAAARGQRARLAAKQRQARVRIAGLEADRQQADEDHDQEVATGIGLGLALLVGAALAFAWRWFRTSPPVAALAGLERVQTLAPLCLGGGFVAIVIGAALMASSGVAAAIGALLLGLGFVMPAALLLARHSLRVERDGASPLLNGRRPPSWASRAAASVLAVLGVLLLAGAAFSDDPESEPVSPRLQAEADSLRSGPGARRLARASADAAAARQRAVEPLAARRRARSALRRSEARLREARAILARSEGAVRRSTRRLAAQVEREERQAEREARRAAKEAEEAEAVSACEPGYSPCVPTYPPDVDCAEVGGPVSVTGSDPHGLDADGDGVGCE